MAKFQKNHFEMTKLKKIFRNGQIKKIFRNGKISKNYFKMAKLKKKSFRKEKK